MKITADTNVLIRALMNDHPTQSDAAKATLREADSVAIPVIALCEIAWVLRRVYRKTRAEISHAVKSYISDPKIVTDLPTVHAGLTMLDAGGGFADGIIAYEGRQLGGEIFVTFDLKAARLIAERGGRAHQPRAG